VYYTKDVSDEVLLRMRPGKGGEEEKGGERVVERREERGGEGW
jgi:hypothetical protein